MVGRRSDRPPFRTTQALLWWAASNWPDLQAKHGWEAGLEDLSAHLGYGFLYQSILWGRDEDEALDIRAALGEEDAIAERNRNRIALVRSAGGEIG